MGELKRMDASKATERDGINPAEVLVKPCTQPFIASQEERRLSAGWSTTTVTLVIKDGH